MFKTHHVVIVLLHFTINMLLILSRSTLPGESYVEYYTTRPLFPSLCSVTSRW